ncbi:putative manganese transporter [Clostridium sp.]|uniref:putative manganese transporter n=1 Tax=Clostridium sp. TaxID=1506 RepID=UPI002FCC58F9
MVEILIDSIRDTIKVVPLLFLIFLAIDYFMEKANNNNKFIDKISKYDFLGGSLFGIIPQCGIPVAMAKLYSNGHITLGMLIAVFISSSDEALIIIGAHPDKFGFVIGLVVVKIIIAMAAGFTINKLIKEKRNRIRVCDANCDCPMCRKHKNILVHNLIHTGRITVFLIITVFIINFGIEHFGQEAFYGVLGRNSFLQPIYASLIGMIPSCASSLVLAEGFIKGAIGLGPLVAGLCANTGYGILIIAKELPLKKTIKIILIVQGISIVIGEIIYMMGW